MREEPSVLRQIKAQFRAEHLVAEAWDKLHLAEQVMHGTALAVDPRSQAIRAEILAMLDGMVTRRIAAHPIAAEEAAS
jgi:hypothetical protein